jgi:5-formyltetrahydrofolate cyclo-ligase
MTKKEIRAMAEGIRKSIGHKEQKMFDEMIINNLFSWSYYKDSVYIFCFVSFRSEIKTSKILKTALAEGKTVTVPKVDLRSGLMKAYIIENLNKDLRPGEYGILEPSDDCTEAEYSKIDLIIAPGLSFTKSGARLGYGGGYYDKFMAKHSDIPVCALTYDRLILDFLPVKDHDIPVDALITEKGVINIG